MQAQKRLLIQAPTNEAAFALACLRTERGEPLEFETTPYLLEVLADQRRTQVCVACSQSRKTVTYFAKTAHRLVYPRGRKTRTAIYTFPRDRDAQEFSKMRVGKMLSAPFFRSRIALDSMSVKQFQNGSPWYFKGTRSEGKAEDRTKATVALSVPTDILVHDELDRSDPAIVQQYTERLRASDDPHRFLFSTPTVPGRGIALEWSGSDQAEWWWTCRECSKEQVFGPLNGEYQWHQHLDLDTPAWRCAHCGVELVHEWVSQGKWVRTAPESRLCAGYHISGIMPNIPAPVLKELHDKALHVDLWVQGHLGLPWVSGDNEINVKALAWGDHANVDAWPTDTYAGLDQGKSLDMVISIGDGQRLVKQFKTWDDIAQAMTRFHIHTLVVDVQPEMRAVQDLVGQFPGRVWMADYSLRTPHGEDAFVQVENESRVRIHRTSGLDWSRNSILMGAAGGDLWPRCDIDLQRIIETQLTSSKRTYVVNSQGIAEAVWVETGPDHIRHAHVYCRVAEQIGLGYGSWMSDPDLIQKLEALRTGAN